MSEDTRVWIVWVFHRGFRVLKSVHRTKDGADRAAEAINAAQVVHPVIGRKTYARVTSHVVTDDRAALPAECA